MDLEYRKGQLCIYRLMVCQEGFCLACAIHHQYKRRKALEDDVTEFKKLFKAIRKEQCVTS